MIELIAVNIMGQWKPGIGDPSVLGWTTTIGYFIAGGLCGAYAVYGRRTSGLGPRVFWWILAIIMVLMGLNKQLDLQVLVLHIARRMSKEQGWFADRDAVRKGIVLSFAFLGLILTMGLGWRCRRVWRRYILVVTGIVFLILFVLIRASGNRLVILGYRPGKLPMYDVLEVGGILCIGISVVIELHRLRQKSNLDSSTSDL
jgi:hypothetical protein